jgi:hypothetical protein
MAPKKQPASRWYNGVTPIEELTTTEQLAHGVVIQYRDLAPSIERIMDAELTEDQREHALLAFRDSLTAVDDPNRDPRVAIANASA